MPTTSKLCHVCGKRPVPPAILRWRHYECYRCKNNFSWSKTAQKKRNQTERYREYDRARHMTKSNPLRAAYRAIGLEQFNLATRGKWRG